MRAPAFFASRMRQRMTERNVRTLVRFGVVLVGMVAAYSVIFHFLMAREGRDFSWITGVYWALTVMSTLGFGDITFEGDLGRLFSLVVLLSGIVFLLVLLPFTFIEFFYEPWIEARAEARVPRTVPATLEGHVVLTLFGPIATALIEKLERYRYPYVVVLPELEEALHLDDAGIRVVVGELDDPETYERVRAEHAALIATTRTDVENTTVVFTARSLTTQVPIVATAREQASVEVLNLAGCSRVLRLGEMMGEQLARRTSGTEVSHVIGRIDDLLIADANAAETPLVGRRAGEANPDELGGVNVVGVWERGDFRVAQPDTPIHAGSVLVLAGSALQLADFDAICRQERPAPSAPRVVIIGGGRVGRATSRALEERGTEWRIVEQLSERIRDRERYVLGSAVEGDTLKRAGIDDATTVVITPRDDETNIYLAIYCRLLRPDIQIISRATLERSVAALHRAGSDFVVSYASLGANAIFNLLKRSDLLMVAEGLDVFKLAVPAKLAGKRIDEADIRSRTGCSVIGLDANGSTVINPGPDAVLETGAEIVLIGTVEAENQFLSLFAD